MSLKKQLEDHCDSIFRSAWSRRDGHRVPNDTDLTYANDGIDIDGAVLYADLSASTQLVDTSLDSFAAEIYKTFLHVCGKIIRHEGGTITAYDGDRIMAVFIEGANRTAAVSCALKINYAVNEIVQARMKDMYPYKIYQVSHTCGVDTSKIMIAKTGVRGANDLVFVGRAANYAAKLCTLKGPYRTWITSDVYNAMLDEVKYGGFFGLDMWTASTWPEMRHQTIYGSDWQKVIE